MPLCFIYSHFHNSCVHIYKFLMNNSISWFFTEWLNKKKSLNEKSLKSRNKAIKVQQSNDVSLHQSHNY
jgi:hypothetical protein